MNLSFLTQFIDANKLGGWVRAGVASLVGVLIAKYPGLGTYLDPATQAALGVIATTVVVGIWSQLIKTDTAKVAAAAALPDVAKIIVKPTASDGIADMAADPTKPKVVTQ
ncbi:MAG: hypothetical protein KGL39_50340 [Patescibacteria group bacterium]|nr:hypothetical protein [Patescibacteria group bacterium]